MAVSTGDDFTELLLVTLALGENSLLVAVPVENGR